MKDKFGQVLAARFRELDQSVDIDATELTSKLVSIRNQRLRRRSKNQLLAGVTISCAVVFGMAYQLLPKAGEQPSVATKAINDDWTPISISPADFEFPIDSIAQAAELNRLEGKIAELKRTSKAQQLTLVRESISRKMFSNDSTLSLFE